MLNTATLPNDPGPFSALFDYKDEVAKEEARQAQLAENEKKIMRTNSIGDAFRLLIDGIGGSKGATITPKGINPGIMTASSRLDALSRQRDSSLERLRMTDMANKSRDIAQNLQTAETARANNFKMGEEAWRRNNELTDQGTKRTNELTDQGTKRGFEVADQADARKEKLTDQGTAHANRLNEQDNSAKNTRITQAEYQKNLLASYKAGRDRSVRVAKEDVEFIIPGTSDHIYISPAELLEMQSRLIGDKQKYDPSLDAALKDLMKNDPVKQETALLTLKKNWDTVKGVLGYPDTAPAQPALIKPDKTGVTDVSSIFN